MSDPVMLGSYQMIDNIDINASVNSIEIKLYYYGKYNYQES